MENTELSGAISELKAIRAALIREVRARYGAEVSAEVAAVLQLERRATAAEYREQITRALAGAAVAPGADTTPGGAVSDLSDLDYLVSEAAETVARVAAQYSAADLDGWSKARAGLLREAIEHERNRKAAETLRISAERIHALAAASGRSLLSVDLREIDRRRAQSELFLEAAQPKNAAVAEIVAKIRVRQARAQLENGLLLTDQMRELIRESVPALLRGEPMLLIGETGGAKTALARYLCEQYLGAAETVSGYGDMTAAQLVGAFELRVVAGATESLFVDGPLLRAMREGKPLIIDEINALPPEFLKRLNIVLQLRPGDTYSVQENQGSELTVAPGFVVLATANEHTPSRYRGLERMSAELTNRFGANSYRVHYPDTGIAFDQTPAENTLLAFAAAVDPHGDLPYGVTDAELKRAARAAFVSQQVFAGAEGEGFDRFVSDAQRIDGAPGLEETVLAPRTLVAIVQKAARSGGAVSLDRALGRFLESVMHLEDRAVMKLILESQGFSL